MTMSHCLASMCIILPSLLSLSACNSMPAFGPAADKIIAAGSAESTVLGDELQFKLIEVDSQTIPEARRLNQAFPRAFLGQVYSADNDTIVPGDQIEVRIWEVSEDGLFARTGDQETILTIQVSNKGDIFVPYAGSIRAEGLTADQLRDLLLERFNGRAVEPEITVDINTTETRAATVLGTVKAPGRFFVPPRGIRLLDLIARSGGAAQAPWELTITVQRGSAVGSASFMDVIDVPTNNIVILPGDTINVNHEPRLFPIFGAVTSPANISLSSRRANLASLLAEVGGLNQSVAQPRSVFVFRPKSSLGIALAYRFDFSRPDALLLAEKFELEPGDITYVSSANVADLERFVSIILSPILGVASTTVDLGS